MTVKPMCVFSSCFIQIFDFWDTYYGIAYFCALVIFSVLHIFFVQMVALLAHARVNNYHNGPMQFPTLQIISGLSNCPTTTAVCVVQKVLSDCLGTYATASRQLELAKLKYFSFHVN